MCRICMAVLATALLVLSIDCMAADGVGDVVIPAGFRDMVTRKDTEIPSGQRPPKPGEVGAVRRSLKVGQVGTINCLVVRQVIDDDSMLVEVLNYAGDPLAILNGYATKGIADGRSINLKTTVTHVSGTTSYTTVLGASKTVLQIDVIPSKTVSAWARGVRFEQEGREWMDKTGRHSVRAIYGESLERGIVRLIKEDGSTVDVSLSDLSEEDRRYAVKCRRDRGS